MSRVKSSISQLRRLVNIKKGHELKAYVKFSDLELNRAFRSIYKGFLTEKEMTDVIEGQDIWLNEEEVCTRWARKTSTLVHTSDSENESKN